MSMYDNLREYRKLLNTSLKFAPWTGDSIWVNQMGFIGSDGNYPKAVAFGSSETKFLTPTGKPIEVVTQFQQDGRDVLEVPLLNPLTNQPTLDEQLLGKEEEQKLTYQEVHLHIFRHGVITQDSKMGRQKLDAKIAKQIMTRAKNQLSDYFRRLIGYQPYLALLEKYSYNLTAATASGGAGLTPVLHPNFYVAGSTKPTWSETPATYATNVAAKLAELSNAAEKRMSAALIKSMVRQASLLKIRPAAQVGGKKLYDIVISEAAAFDLSKDEEFRAAFNYAYMGGKQASELEYGQIDGKVFFNAVIHVDQNIPDVKITGDSGHDTSKTVSFGNTDYMKNPLSTGNRNLAILFGASAVACGYGAPLQFESEDYDYKYKKTEGADMLVGFERTDIQDFDGKFGTAGLKENASSLVVAHWADNSVTF